MQSQQKDPSSSQQGASTSQTRNADDDDDSSSDGDSSSDDDFEFAADLDQQRESSFSLPLQPLEGDDLGGDDLQFEEESNKEKPKEKKGSSTKASSKAKRKLLDEDQVSVCSTASQAKKSKGSDLVNVLKSRTPYLDAITSQVAATSKAISSSTEEKNEKLSDAQVWAKLLANKVDRMDTLVAEDFKLRVDSLAFKALHGKMLE